MKPQQKQKQQKSKAVPKKIASDLSDKLSGKWIIAIIGMLVLTYIIYTPAFKNKLTSWDDKNYITIDKDIQKLDAEHVKKIFALESACKMGMGNYHPLTMLSYAIEYHYAKLDPVVYHTTNIILHLINILLVFLFIRILSRKNIIAYVTALLFAIHTMHVESVAWVAERKDLLYTLFEISALMAYAWYIRSPQKRITFYLLSLILFVFSVLSKGMAVSMAVILPLIDYYSERKLLSKKVIFEKIPYIIIAIIFGLIAYTAQKSTKAIVFTDYSFYDRILFACYGIITYLWKCIIPVNLSCFYNYPNAGTYGWYIVYVILFVALSLLVYKFRNFSRVIIFGFLFFLFSVALVLQIIPVGGAVIADRYTYIAYTGLFIMIGHGIAYLWENRSAYSRVLVPSLGFTFLIFVIFFSVGTYQRCFVWKDTLTVWNDALTKYPSSIKGYNGRGDAYNDLKEYELAVKDLSKAIEMKQDYSDAYYNRGISYYWLGKKAQDAGQKETAMKYYEQAIKDNSSAIKYSPDLACAYFNRSGNYYTIGKYESALSDAMKAIELNMEVDSLYIKALKSNIQE